MRVEFEEVAQMLCTFAHRAARVDRLARSLGIETLFERCVPLNEAAFETLMQSDEYDQFSQMADIVSFAVRLDDGDMANFMHGLRAVLAKPPSVTKH